MNIALLIYGDIYNKKKNKCNLMNHFLIFNVIFEKRTLSNLPYYTPAYISYAFVYEQNFWKVKKKQGARIRKDSAK